MSSFGFGDTEFERASEISASGEFTNILADDAATPTDADAEEEEEGGTSVGEDAATVEDDDDDFVWLLRRHNRSKSLLIFGVNTSLSP